MLCDSRMYPAWVDPGRVLHACRASISALMCFWSRFSVPQSVHTLRSFVFRFALRRRSRLTRQSLLYRHQLFGGQFNVDDVHEVIRGAAAASGKNLPLSVAFLVAMMHFLTSLPTQMQIPYSNHGSWLLLASKQQSAALSHQSAKVF